MFCLLCKASITTAPGAEDKAPPARADVESAKLSSDENVIVHSKRVGSIDVDKAGGVSQDDDTDDADGQVSDRKGSNSDVPSEESTKDTDDNAEEDGGLDSDKNAHEPESGSSDTGDLG